jgi:hypothetical protein
MVRLEIVLHSDKKRKFWPICCTVMKNCYIVPGMCIINRLAILIIPKFLCIHRNLFSLVLIHLHSYNSNPLFSIDFFPLYCFELLILNHFVWKGRSECISQLQDS